MTSKREAITMSDDEVTQMLTEVRTVTVCTIGPDGVPDPVAMWFVQDENGDLWMRTYAASQKVRNLRRDPRVAVLADTGEDYLSLRGVQFSGTMELVTQEDRICWVFAELMVKYSGLPRADVAAVRESYRAKAARQVALRLCPSRTASWDHRKMAGG